MAASPSEPSTRRASTSIYTVCERIRKERPDCWVATIHDSILTLPDNVEYVLSVMRDEFGKLGVAPRLEPRQPGT